ncbi:hypothetical protein [Colwellia sp. MEBiC06753]
MRNKGFQTGLLFNHLPEIVFFATNLFSSDTDLLVKMSRKIKKDESITRDHQFFRKAANNELSPEELANYFLPENSAFAERFNILTEHDFDVSCIGAWFILLSQVNGFRLSLNSDDKELSNYLAFIEGLCLVEYQFIKAHKGNNDFGEVNEFLTSWLKCSAFESLEPKQETKAKYLICLVMHWAALFEKLLEIEYQDAEEGYKSILVNSLPKIRSKKNTSYFNLTTEEFITQIKSNLFDTSSLNGKTKWIDFYREIARKQLTDSKVSPKPLKSDDQRLLDPETSAIKKQISRWFDGSRISIDHVKKYFLILKQPYDPGQHDFSLWAIEFINVFTYIQHQLLTSGVPAELIVQEFSRYEEFKKLVDIRYKKFCSSGFCLSK